MISGRASFLQPLLADVQRRLPRSDAPDGELLRRFSETHGADVFEEIMHRHGAMVLNVCQGILENQADAEDAFQATFLVLARRSNSIKKGDSLGSWLYGVALRVSNRLRSLNGARRTVPLPEIASSAKCPSRDLSWRETHRVCLEELAKLPDRYREPIVLCYLEGKTVETVAQLLGLPKGTLKGRLERARRLLRHRLIRRGLGPATCLLLFAGLGAEFAKAVPTALLQGTAALAVADLPVKSVSPLVLTLAQGVIQAMWWTKIKIGMVTAFSVVTVVLGLGWLVLPSYSVPAALAQAPGGARKNSTIPDAKPNAPSVVDTVDAPQTSVPGGLRPGKEPGPNIAAKAGKVGDPESDKLVARQLKYLNPNTVVSTLGKVAELYRLKLRIATLPETNAVLLEGDNQSLEAAQRIIAALDEERIPKTGNQVLEPSNVPVPEETQRPVPAKRESANLRTKILHQGFDVDLAEIQVARIQIELKYLKAMNFAENAEIAKTIELKQLDLREAQLQLRRQEWILRDLQDASAK